MSFKPDLFFKVLARPVTFPIESALRRFWRQVNPRVISLKIARSGSMVLKGIVQGKQRDLGHYILLRNWYVAKILLLVFVVLAILLPLLYVNFVHPEVARRFGSPKLYVSSEKLAKYSGNATVLDLQGQMLYKGYVVNGLFHGPGAIYHANGLTAYKGEFVGQEFDGLGELYFSNGQLQYKGSFARSLYNGYGDLYNEAGYLIYQGYFVDGLFQGAGVAYDGTEAQNKLFEGQYLANLAHGYGTLYQDSEIVYQGEFVVGKATGMGKFAEPTGLVYEGGLKDGLKDGLGTLNDAAGNIVYKGGFEKGLYSGDGQLYAADGVLLYKGGFENGMYNGEGQYLSETGELIYKGEFVNNAYNGKGVLYNGNGLVIYEGDFNSNLRHGWGTLHDASGKPLYSGLFKYDCMDFGAMLGGKAPDLQNAFQNSGLSQGYEAGAPFRFYISDARLALLLTSAPKWEETVASKVVVWGDANYYGVQNGMLLADVYVAVGAPYKEGLEATGRDVLPILNYPGFIFNAYFMQTIPQPSLLYQAHFYFSEGDLEVTTYSNAATSEVLFYSVEKYLDENERAALEALRSETGKEV